MFYWSAMQTMDQGSGPMGMLWKTSMYSLMYILIFLPHHIYISNLQILLVIVYSSEFN